MYKIEDYWTTFWPKNKELTGQISNLVVLYRKKSIMCRLQNKNTTVTIVGTVGKTSRVLMAF